jgi:hypothetical protein
MIRRSIALDAGGFEESFPRLYDDQVFLAKLFLRTGVIFSPLVWMDYRKHDRSCTANMSTRDYVFVHRRFLDWFEGYVLEQDPPHREQVLGRIRNARREIQSVHYVRLLWRARRLALRALSRVGFEERYRRDFITD